MEHFDKEGLIGRVKGNMSLYDKLIVIAKEDIPCDISLLEKYLEEKNYQLVKETGHSLKGTGLNMGFSVFADIALKIEKISEADYGKLPELISSLKEEFDVVKGLIG